MEPNLRLFHQANKMFQPFLRFWRVGRRYDPYRGGGDSEFQPFLRFWGMYYPVFEIEDDYDCVSTLLEILGLVWLVVVGF